MTTPANPDDLITWLPAQLDADEAHARKDMYVAQRATPGEWRTRYGVNLPSSWVETESTPVARLDGPRHEDDGMLIQRFRPGNVLARAEQRLAEVDAKRRILDRHRPRLLKAQTFRPPMLQCEHCADLCHSRSGLGCDEPIDAPWPCPDIRDLASIYADRPGYREEWKP